MKTFLITITLVAFTASEPPPSNSYLPPPATLSSGYPKGPQASTPFNAGVPEVVAARSIEGHGHETHGNGFARNNHHSADHSAHARFASNGNHEHDQNEFGRNAVEDDSVGPANYNFGYMVNDYQEGTEFGHHEERLDESAHGQYHVVLPDGRRQTVSYQANARGFKPRVSYQDTEELARSGYDSNASNVRSAANNYDSGFGRNNHGTRSNGY